MSYIPLTDWNIVQCTDVGDRKWYGLAARIVVDSDTAVGTSYHIYAEYTSYAIWVPSSAWNDCQVIWYYENLSNYISPLYHSTDFTTGVGPVGDIYRIDKGAFYPGGDAKPSAGPAKTRMDTGGTRSCGPLNKFEHTIQTVTVSYDANGGNGTVGTQTRIKVLAGVQNAPVLVLSDGSGIDRLNYELVGWNTAADGSGTSYNLGATYAGDSDLTLYAVWNRLQSHITYLPNRPNGATGQIVVPQQGTKNPGEIYYIAGFQTTPQLSPPYYFVEWNTLATGNGDGYQPGDGYENDSDMTLYAIWKTNYI